MSKADVNVNGITYSVEIGTKLKDILHISIPCGGHGRCGKCKVYAEGKISQPSIAEKSNLTPEEIQKGIRLACMTYVEGNCSVKTLTKEAENKILTKVNIRADVNTPLFSKYGLAVDIGTTTIAANLFDIKGNIVCNDSKMNPQSHWGADVISRIEASMKGSKSELAEAVCNTLDEMISDIAKKADINTADFDGLVITGNTAMLHLLTKTDVEPLSKAPFKAKRLFNEYIKAEELNLKNLLPQTQIYLPPCISAFIGADTVCAMTASNIGNGNKTEILADIGTNGEMVLSHNGKLYACSTAAGPAFEGAGISMGMNGKTGAIDKVKIYGGEMFAHVIGEEDPVGICGSGLVDAIACLLELEILDETGYLEGDEIEISSPVKITHDDVRKVQTAKSAIISGIKTMMKAVNVGNGEISKLIVAGGFGNYLNAENAGKIGLLPKELLSRTEVAGNAALSGASMILLNSDFKAKAEALANTTEVLNLDANPVFTEEFVENMFFG